MSYGKQITAELASAQDVIAKIRQGLQAKIKDLPDNPRITRSKGSTGSLRGFTISSKDVGLNWGVVYHDFKSMYEKIAEELDKGDPAKVVEKLQDIITAKVIRDRNVSVHLHPDIVNNLKRLLEG